MRVVLILDEKFIPPHMNHVGMTVHESNELFSVKL